MGIYIKQLQEMENTPPENEAVTFELNAFMRDLEEYLTYKLGKEVTIFMEASKYEHYLTMWAIAPAKTVVDNQSPILHISSGLKNPAVCIIETLRSGRTLPPTMCHNIKELRKRLLEVLTHDKISGIIKDLGAR